MPVDHTAPPSGRYDTGLDIRYPHLAVIDIPAIVAETVHPGFNQTLTKVNDAVVRLGIVCGEYHWHQHDHDDELSLVLDGELHIDIADGRGVTTDKTAILMVESAGIVPTGSAP